MNIGGGSQYGRGGSETHPYRNERMVGLDARFLSWVNTGQSSLVNILRLSLVKSTPVSDMTPIFEKLENRGDSLLHLGFWVRLGGGKSASVATTEERPPCPPLWFIPSPSQVPWPVPRLYEIPQVY